MPGDGMREYMLYLSLYDGVDSLEIGVDSTAVITPSKVNLPVCEKPIVMYGTSTRAVGLFLLFCRPPDLPEGICYRI